MAYEGHPVGLVNRVVFDTTMCMALRIRRRRALAVSMCSGVGFHYNVDVSHDEIWNCWSFISIAYSTGSYLT